MRALTSQDALCGQDCALHPRHSAWEVGMARARGGRSAEKWGPPRQEGYGVSPLCCPLDAPPGACVWYCTLAPPPGFGDLCPSSHWAPLKAHRSDLPCTRFLESQQQSTTNQVASTTETYCFTVLEVTGPKSRGPQGGILLRAVRKSHVPELGNSLSPQRR